MLAPIDTKTSSSVERVGLRPTPRSTRLESGTSSAATMKNAAEEDRKSTRLNSSHLVISYAVFCLKKKKNHTMVITSISYLVVVIAMQDNQSVFDIQLLFRHEDRPRRMAVYQVYVQLSTAMRQFA